MAGEEDYAPIELGKNKVVRVTKFKVKTIYFSPSSCNKEIIISYLKNKFEFIFQHGYKR